MDACRFVRQRLNESIGNDGSLTLLGPTPLPVVRVNNRFRYRVTVHGTFDKEIRERVAGILCKCNTENEYKGVSVFADLNPME